MLMVQLLKKASANDVVARVLVLIDIRELSSTVSWLWMLSRKLSSCLNFDRQSSRTCSSVAPPTQLNIPCSQGKLNTHR